MTQESNIKKVIISGGGTGGHIYPAVAIADEIKRRNPQVQILFIGASDRMEMKKVPEAGYEIQGLDVAGLDRKNLLRNIKILYRFWKGMRKATSILRTFKPQLVIGVGGYASAAIMKAANKQRIPTLIQEQNSYAGVANKLLAKDAMKICVAYDNMQRFFPLNKIVKTGNPCRQSLLDTKESKEEARVYFDLSAEKKTLLIIGGSLGSKTLNVSVLAGIKELMYNDMQVIWQCGSYYLDDMQRQMEHVPLDERKNIKMLDFIQRMDLAYKAADLVVARAGAGSISELCLLGKACILVPSPNVAEDHQTKNAMALVEKDAALLMPDNKATQQLINLSITTINDSQKLTQLEENIKKLAQLDSVERIVDEIEKIVG